MSAGPTLRRYRDQCGYTQEALAAAVGVSWSSVAQWESGKITPRRKTAERIDVALGAGGALLAAFGYVTRPDDDPTTALRAQVADLAEQVAALSAGLAAMGAEVARLRDQRRRGGDE